MELAPDTLNKRTSFLEGKRLVLAPLVGGSDLSFRLLARKYGAQLTYTEMCVADYYLRKLKDDTQKLKRYVFDFEPVQDAPLIMQLTSTKPENIIELANLPIFQGKVQMVDLNCGCPQNFALDHGYGAALLRDADKLVDMCSRIASNIPFPLSLKCRLHENTNYTVALLKRLERVGVKAFAVHGRYAWQRGSNRGNADWDAIREIKREIPNAYIIGNGDIGKYEDFQRMIDYTGADGAMAGYGALLNPSIFQSEYIPLATLISDYLAIAVQHTNSLIDVLRHIAWMIKKYRIQPMQKSRLFACQNLHDIKAFLLALTPPVEISVPAIAHTLDDHIRYPKKESEMTPSERRAAARRAAKLTARLEKKAKEPKEKDLDDVDDLVAG